MKRTMLGLVLVAMLGGTSWAQETAPKKGRLGAGVVLGLPLGNWGDLVDFTLGAVADGDYVVTPQISITGRIGFLFHITGLDGASFWTIPIWGGGKYYLGQGPTRLFVAAETGFNYSHSSFDTTFGSVSDSSIDIALNLGAGLDIGAIEVRGTFAILDLGNAGDSIEIMASATYFFASF